MEEKSNLWDIFTVSEVTYKRVTFLEEVTEKEAKEKFIIGDFDYYDEADTNYEQVIKITSAEKY